MSSQPLAGIRVLDLSRLLPGPYCTLLLADLGAEVVKIETPRIGDYARFLPADMGLAGMFAALNRNKKSVALNYRNPRGRDIFLRLAQEADVVLESFRPGAVKRWGIDYEAVREANPRVIYCSLSGYGQSGPYRDRAGHDPNYISVGGLLGINGAEAGPPLLPGVQIADLAGGMLAAIAILGAVVGRERTGEGAYLDVAMLDAVVSWVAPVAGAMFLSAGREPERGRTALSGELPCYHVYQTADGQFVTLAALEPDFWAAFCKVVERDDLLPRQLDHGAIREIDAIFRARPRADWLARFQGVDACLEPVNSLAEMWQHPQVRHRGLASESGGGGRRFESPFRYLAPEHTSPAPGLGEHTRQVLARAGLGEDELGELEARGVVKTASGPTQ
jgi:crotonobetainyl-CoA:carnitine CoA-transferase CaiB-like acyl-CoA transferase